MEAKEHAETKERQRGSKPARVNYPYEFTVLKLLKNKKNKKRQSSSLMLRRWRKKKGDTYRNIQTPVFPFSSSDFCQVPLLIYIAEKKKKKKGKNGMIKRSEEQLPAGVSIRAL